MTPEAFRDGLKAIIADRHARQAREAATARFAVEALADAEARLGRSLDVDKHLPPGKEEYSHSEVINAVGKALAEAGIPNTLRGEAP